MPIGIWKCKWQKTFPCHGTREVLQVHWMVARFFGSTCRGTLKKIAGDIGVEASSRKHTRSAIGGLRKHWSSKLVSRASTTSLGHCAALLKDHQQMSLASCGAGEPGVPVLKNGCPVAAQTWRSMTPSLGRRGRRSRFLHCGVALAQYCILHTMWLPCDLLSLFSISLDILVLHTRIRTHTHSHTRAYTHTHAHTHTHTHMHAPQPQRSIAVAAIQSQHIHTQTGSSRPCCCCCCCLCSLCFFGTLRLRAYWPIRTAAHPSLAALGLCGTTPSRYVPKHMDHGSFGYVCPRPNPGQNPIQLLSCVSRFIRRPEVDAVGRLVARIIIPRVLLIVRHVHAQHFNTKNGPPARAPRHPTHRPTPPTPPSNSRFWNKQRESNGFCTCSVKNRVTIFDYDFKGFWNV